MKDLMGTSILKDEESVKKYLKNLSDSEIDNWYESIEFTPFPILLAKEHFRRHKSTGKMVLDDIKLNANKIKRKGKSFGKDTTKSSKKISNKIHATTAKKIKKGVNSVKKKIPNSEEDVILLKKLGELRKSKVITKKEFEEKKKKILARI